SGALWLIAWQANHYWRLRSRALRLAARTPATVAPRAASAWHSFCLSNGRQRNCLISECTFDACMHGAMSARLHKPCQAMRVARLIRGDMAKAIGIDLGTPNSVVAVYDYGTNGKKPGKHE